MELATRLSINRAGWVLGILDYWSVGFLSGTPSLHYPNSLREQNPRIFAASALRGVDHQRAFLECDSGQSSGQNVNILAIENVRPQIDVPAGKLALDNDRCPGKPQGRLGNVVARIILNSPGEFRALVLRAVRPHQPAAATRFIDSFHDQLVQM